MSIEENKAITRRILDEVLNKGNLDVIGDLISTDLIYHAAGQPVGIEVGSAAGAQHDLCFQLPPSKRSVMLSHYFAFQ